MTIRVEKLGEGEFRVTVEERGGSTSHTVRVKPAVYDRLCGGKISAEELVRRSFEFLLAREPKESILASFDLEVISRYFPDYESEIKSRLAH